MSWITEYEEAMGSAFGEEIAFEREQEDERLTKGIWQDAKGNETHVSRLDDRHLMCIERKILREHWRMEWLPIIRTEIERRNLR